MKLLIISDSHGHIANIKHVLGFGQKIKVGAVIHCGDWDDLASFEAAQAFGLPIYSVLGNADVNSDLEDALKFECKKFDPYFLKLEIDGVRIGVVHKLTKDLVSSIESLNIVFSGHYHSKNEQMINWTKFVRPGAIVNGINFAIYETVSGTIEFVEDVQV